MANTGGSSDPSMKTDDAAANVDDCTTSTANDLPEMENTTKDTGGLAAVDEAPAAGAPADLPRLKACNCVIVLTDPEGKPATIGSLLAIESPACIIQLRNLSGHRETSLALCARFPRFGSDNDATVEQFQRIWFHFYGDSFETFESDFVMTKVNEYEELPDILTDRVSVLRALGHTLHKLQLTYKPEKVVTKGKDDPDDFLMPESSHAAQLFRYLVEGETPKTFSLYFQANAPAVYVLNAVRDRLEYEMIVKPSVEYRNKNGKIVIQYGKILA